MTPLLYSIGHHYWPLLDPLSGPLFGHKPWDYGTEMDPFLGSLLPRYPVNKWTCFMLINIVIYGIGISSLFPMKRVPGNTGFWVVDSTPRSDPFPVSGRPRIWAPGWRDSWHHLWHHLWHHYWSHYWSHSVHEIGWIPTSSCTCNTTSSCACNQTESE